jgi:hypothetical protein
VGVGINGGNAQVVDGGVGKGSITVQSKPVRMGDQGALFVNICSFVSRAFSNICHRLLIHIDRWKLTKNSDPKIALIPYYHRFFQTELFGFIFPTIVDNRFVNPTIEGKMKPKSSVWKNLW